MHDVERFVSYCEDEGVEDISKMTSINYKESLVQSGRYSARSINAMLAAINSFFKHMNWYDCVVKALKIQQDTFRSADKELTKEEYERLLEAAKAEGSKTFEVANMPWWLALAVVILCAIPMYWGIQWSSMAGTMCSIFFLAIVFNELGERLPVWNKYIGCGLLMVFFGVALMIVIGAVIGAATVGYLVGFYPVDSAITAGLCMANRGGNGDLACLGAAHRMELIAYAQLSSRLGGAIVLIIESFVFAFLL